MRRKCSIVLLMTALLCGAAAARTVEGTVVDSEWWIIQWLTAEENSRLMQMVREQVGISR